MEDEEFVPVPPTANRIGARAVVLAAVSCRGLIEKDAKVAGADKLRLGVIRWLQSIDAQEELEPLEVKLLTTPLGQLDRKVCVDASWQSEGMVVLAWALGYLEFPPFHTACEPTEVANSMGFLQERAKTPLHAPVLREFREIEEWADRYLALHWRLRQFSMDHTPMDFASYAPSCWWGALRIDGLEIVERDLAIDGVRRSSYGQTLPRMPKYCARTPQGAELAHGFRTGVFTRRNQHLNQYRDYMGRANSANYRNTQASGREAVALSEVSAKTPAQNRGKAAAAIMAALSVERARLGKKVCMPEALPFASKTERSCALAATPPETRMVDAPQCSAAINVRSQRSRTTAFWNSRTRHRVCREQSASSCSNFRSPR